MVGLSRGIRESLALPGYAAVDQLEVAEAAWSLAARLGRGLGPFERDNDALVDFVVGVVEAIDEFMAVAEGRGDWPKNIELRVEAEAAAWVDDFLYDNPGVRFPGATGETTEVSLFTVAHSLAQALAEAVGAVPPER
jgi:hypothetical protein